MAPAYPTNAISKHEIHHLEKLQNWSVITAYALAAAAGIKLSQQHIEVLYWIRAEYDQFGTGEMTALLEKLERDFNIPAAFEYIEKLFPSDPLTQWMRIAGLPIYHENKQNTYQ